MATFERAVTIRVARAPLFALTQDYSRRLEWDPYLQQATLLGGAVAPAVGVRAWCVEKRRYGLRGMGMETEYVRFAPPAVVAVKMTRGPAILSRFAASWRFQEVAPETTRVVWRYHLALRPPWLRPLLTPIAVAVFSRDMSRRLSALKVRAEATLPHAGG